MLTINYLYKCSLPLLLGAISFFAILGFTQLDPSNIGWLLGRLDPTQHYLGWIFYRDGPWTFPVGLSPDFGLDISSSIVYADAVPFLAIFFKIFRFFLPERFQYFGFWILCCFLLQSWFGWKLTGLIFKNIFMQFLATAILVFSPPMLWRLVTPSGTHAALMSHFLILASFYLVFRQTQQHRILYWAVLLSFATLINFYFLFMASAIWIADLDDRFLVRKTVRLSKVIYEIAIILFWILFLAWQAGYFAIASSSVDTWGYGFFRMNLLAPFNPEGWSFVMRDIDMASTWGEGYSYMGLGIIIAAIFALPIVFAEKNKLKEKVLRHRYLLITLVFLTLLAITNNIGLGLKSYPFELPNTVLSIFGILHSAARLFWPMYYMLALVFFWLIAKGYPNRIGVVMVIVLFSAQVLDSSNGWHKIQASLAKDHTHEIDAPRLSSPIWIELATHYQKMVHIPAENKPPFWETMTAFAAKHHLATNAIFTARIDSSKIGDANTKLNTMIKFGNFAKDTFYILTNQFVIPILAIKKPNDVVFRINETYVFAPNWNSCQQCLLSSKEAITMDLKYFSPELGKPILFSSKPQIEKELALAFQQGQATSNQFAPYFLQSGWTSQEDWGTWSDGKEAIINLVLPRKKSHGVELDLKANILGNQNKNLQLEIWLNGIFNQEIVLSKPNNNHLLLFFPSNIEDQKTLSITFKIANLVIPVKSSMKIDTNRALGIGLVSAKFF